MVPRFIEFMPMSEGALWAPGSFLPAAEIRRAIEASFPAHHLEPLPTPSGAGPARYYRLEADAPRVAEPGGERLLGVIAAISEGFCEGCNRVRLSAVGRLHACLGHDDGVDLRAPLRAGGEAAVVEAIRQAVAAKPERHAFTPLGCGGPVRHMVSIGG